MKTEMNNNFNTLRMTLKIISSYLIRVVSFLPLVCYVGKTFISFICMEGRGYNKEESVRSPQCLSRKSSQGTWEINWSMQSNGIGARIWSCCIGQRVPLILRVLLVLHFYTNNKNVFKITIGNCISDLRIMKNYAAITNDFLHEFNFLRIK